MALTVEESIPLVVFTIFTAVIVIALLCVRFQHRLADRVKRRMLAVNGKAYAEAMWLQSEIQHASVDKGHLENGKQRKLKHVTEGIMSSALDKGDDVKRPVTPPTVSVYESLLSPVVTQATCYSLPNICNGSQRMLGSKDRANRSNERSRLKTDGGHRCSPNYFFSSQKKEQELTACSHSQHCTSSGSQSRCTGREANAERNDHYTEFHKKWTVPHGKFLTRSHNGLNQRWERNSKSGQAPPRRKDEVPRRESCEMGLEEASPSPQLSVPRSWTQSFNITRPALPTIITPSGACVDCLRQVAVFCPPPKGQNHVYQLKTYHHLSKPIERQRFRSRSNVTTNYDISELRNQSPPSTLNVNTSLVSWPPNLRRFYARDASNGNGGSLSEVNILRERCKQYPNQIDKNPRRVHEETRKRSYRRNQYKDKAFADARSKVCEYCEHTWSSFLSQSQQAGKRAARSRASEDERRRERASSVRANSEPDVTLTEMTALATSSTWGTH